MNREQIIQMARDSGFELDEPIPIYLAWDSDIERFAAAIRSAVKEEDANICEKQADMVVDQRGAAPVKAMMCASAIRSSK